MKRMKILLSIIVLQNAWSFSSGQSIDELLQIAVQNNPDLKAVQLQYEAALSKADQVNQLQQPSIGIGIPVERPETRLGAQVLMINASQMFPWFGTLKAKKDISISMAKSEYERITLMRLDLFFEIRSAYYHLNLITEQQALLQNNLSLYQSLENVALGKVESGKSTIADVLRIQIKLNGLESNVQILENLKIPFNAKLQEITNSNFDKVFDIKNEIGDPALVEIDFEQERMKLSQFHPLVAQIQARVEVSEQRMILNRNTNAPNFTLGLDYSMVDERLDANPKFNGRNILIPKLMFSVPIYRKQFQAAQKEEQLKQLTLEQKKKSIENKLITSLKRSKSEFDNALLRIDLSREQSKKTNIAYEILLSEYSSSGKKFDELIQLQDQLLNYQLDELKANVETHLISAKVDRITNF